MFERFTDTARRVVILAQEEARMLNHNYIGTEHLLLALLGDRGVAGKALSDTGATHEEARAHVAGIIGRGTTEVTGHIAFTPHARTVLEASLRIALELTHGYIGSEHLLLALLSEPKSVAAETLMRCGVARATVAHQLAALITADPAPAPAPGHGFALSA